MTVSTGQAANALPHYSREMPRDWPALTAYAESLWPAETRDIAPQQKAAHEMFGLVDHLLDQEEAEVYRYYGLGLAMCEVMRDLRRPAVRERLISLGVRRIVASNNWNRAEGLCIDDFALESIQAPWRGEVRYSCQRLAPETALLINALEVVAASRLGALQGGRHVTGSPTDRQVMRIVSQVAAPDAIADAATQGALFVVQKAYWHQVCQASPPGSRSHRLEEAPMRTISRRGLIQVAQACAGMRTDEILFNTELTNRLLPRDNGPFRFDHTQVPASPGPSEDGLHSQRLGCPAVGVAGLLPASLQIVSDALLRAAEHARPVS